VNLGPWRIRIIEVGIAWAKRVQVSRGSHRGAMGDLKGNLWAEIIMRRVGEKRDWTPSNSSRRRKAISKKDQHRFDELRENWRGFFKERDENFIGKLK